MAEQAPGAEAREGFGVAVSGDSYPRTFLAVVPPGPSEMAVCCQAEKIKIGSVVSSTMFHGVPTSTRESSGRGAGAGSAERSSQPGSGTALDVSSTASKT